MSISKNSSIFLRLSFYLFAFFAWSAMFLCSLELYERLRWRNILRKNELILDAQLKRAKFTQAFSDSLWDKPWISYKKNLEVTFNLGGRQFQIKTNNVGLRDDFVTLPKPGNVFRILCIGGSTTVEGWTNATTYPNLLEKQLQKAFASQYIEVINCGVSGLDSYGELKKATEYLDLNPDLIIEYNAVNDICWRYIPHLKKHASWWKQILWNSRFLTRHMNWHLLPGEKAVKAYFNRTTLHNLRSLYKAAAGRNIPMVFCSFSRPDIDTLGNEARNFFESDIENVWRGEFVNFESYCRIVDIYNKSLKKMCRDNDIPYIPVAEHHQGELDYFIDICHLTNKGIQEKVNIIFKYLQPLLVEMFPPESADSPTPSVQPDSISGKCSQYFQPDVNPVNGHYQFTCSCKTFHRLFAIRWYPFAFGCPSGTKYSSLRISSLINFSNVT